MKKLLFVFIFFMIPAFSWNEVGHVLSSEIAWKMIPTAKRNILQKYAILIYNKSPNILQKKIQHYQYLHASLFAVESILPDLWTTMHGTSEYSWKGPTTLGDVFRMYNVDLPKALEKFQHIPEGKLHYINIEYHHPNVIIDPNNNIVTAIQAFQTAYKQSTSDIQKALILIFIEHFYEDIRQPLRTSINQQDAYDNTNFCLPNEKPINGWCKNNIHYIWDEGSGYLKESNIKNMHGFKALADQLIQKYPQSLFTQELSATYPMQWARDDFQYLNFAYESTPNEYLIDSNDHIRENQAIALRQITLAGDSFAQWVNNTV